MQGVILGLFIFLLVAGMTIYLQIYLSKMKNKWLGLILPILSFIYSLFMVLSIVVFETLGKGEYLVIVISTLNIFKNCISVCMRKILSYN